MKRFRALIGLLGSIAIIISLMVACSTTSGFVKFYQQISPRSYKNDSNKWIYVFSYNGYNLKKVYDLLFNEYEIIGQSGFKGKYENPKTNVISKAREVGADIVVTTAVNPEEEQYTFTYVVPNTSTTRYHGTTNYHSSTKGYVGTGKTTGTSTTTSYESRKGTGTRVTYKQYAFFLKNKSNEKPLWERTEDDYKVIGKSKFDGFWQDQQYSLKIYRSKNGIVVGAIAIDSQAKSFGQRTWKKGEVKFIFNPNKNVGLYLMNDKTPMPVNISIDRYGYLTFTLLNKHQIKFAKISEDELFKKSSSSEDEIM